MKNFRKIAKYFILISCLLLVNTSCKKNDEEIVKSEGEKVSEEIKKLIEGKKIAYIEIFPTNDYFLRAYEYTIDKEFLTAYHDATTALKDINVYNLNTVESFSLQEGGNNGPVLYLYF